MFLVSYDQSHQAWNLRAVHLHPDGARERYSV